MIGTQIGIGQRAKGECSLATVPVFQGAKQGSDGLPVLGKREVALPNGLAPDAVRLARVTDVAVR